MLTFPNIFNEIVGVFPDVFAKDASGAGSTDGTEYKKTVVDELIFGWIQKTLLKVGQTPNSVAETSTDSQIYDAMNEGFNTPEIKLLNTSAAIVFGKTNFAVEFDTSGGNLAPPALPLPDFVGQTVDFVASGSGTATIAAGNGIVFDQVISDDKGRSLVAVKVSGALQWELLVDEKRICKAWCNFNGTGVVAIRDEYNVSSITDNGTGDYTVNFINAMNDVNYIFTWSSNDSVATAVNHLIDYIPGTNIKTVSAQEVLSTRVSAATSRTLKDVSDIELAFFGS